ncbi:hypothetical protein AX774_g3807 [Zancudomyces culisetae]|uniref:Uncharacterized protein n=1 Tax=Zancudomyces culisetae TaxID=1213189 RepID=A0A1R1PP25_ZANCU|nr:hypothetical protein AX774_g3807 [Zancudomyces culisetae]|eukprot:OMH82708.1 hypothetical protein AX774_g3807 [Zancudomyces culisetae]
MFGFEQSKYEISQEDIDGVAQFLQEKHRNNKITNKDSQNESKSMNEDSTGHSHVEDFEKMLMSRKDLNVNTRIGL